MRTRLTGILPVLIAAAALVPATARADSAITLTAGSQQVLANHAVTLSGKLTGAPAGTQVQLSGSPYPYASSAAIATTTTAADGSFSFTVSPDRSTHYEAAVPGTPTAASVEIAVIAREITKVQNLPLGRVRVTIVVFHPSDLAWNGARVRWRFASGRRGTFAPAPSTTTRRLSQYVTLMRTSIALPAGRFSFRACLKAPDTGALISVQQPPDCTGLGFRGGGSLPAGFPSASAVSRAAQFLAGRTGRKAFAVIDTEGRLAGVNVHWTFPTASVVKAMLLVAYLRRLDARGQHHVDSYSNSFLYPMIHVSDNNAATQCWSIVGDSGLYAVAHAAGMTDFSVSGLWGTALLSPADQARFFFEMDSLIPKEFVGYARFLLSTIIAWQAFGMPPIARPLGYKVFFKDGSEPTGLGQLVHQVARFEGHHRIFSIAVMTDGDPTMQYGIDTLAGVARALLG